VLVGVLGYKDWYKLKAGKIIINKDGSNSWSTTSSGQHHLVEDKPAAFVGQLINELIMHQPVKKD
jgi:hypothetical protein